MSIIDCNSKLDNLIALVYNLITIKVTGGNLKTQKIGEYQYGTSVLESRKQEI
jgi:hypothetical protein